MVTRKEVIAMKKAIEKAEKGYQKALTQYKDGFMYIVVIYSYGHRRDCIFHNDIACAQEFDKWDGDTGIVYCVTNNPKYKGDSIIFSNNPKEKAKEI